MRGVLILLFAVLVSWLLPSKASGQDFQGNGLSGVLMYALPDGTAYAALPQINGGFQSFSYKYNLFSPGFNILRTGHFFGTRRADVILYNTNTAQANIGMGNADGTFNFALQSLFWSSGYDIVELGDINGDGLTDVALYNSSTGTLYTGICNGNGGFAYKYHYVGPGFTFVKLADFTGDGNADLLLYNRANGYSYLGVGDGSGNFNFTALTTQPGYDVNDIGDLNGDGKMDVVFYNSSNGNQASGISLGASGATFNGFSFVAQLWSPGFTSVAAADYRGNQKADVTVYNQNNGLAYFLSGNGDGTFSSQSLFWSPGYDNVVAEDVDGDGRTDVILYNSATGTEYTGISNGAGAFTYKYALWGQRDILAKSVPPLTTPLPSSSTLIPFGWNSPAETLMFTAKTSSPSTFSLVIENAGRYSTNGHVVAANACYIEYFVSGNVLTLGDDNLDAQYWVNPGGTTPGTQAQVPAAGQDPTHTNHQCTLDISRSWVKVTASGQMKLQLALTFQPSWNGPKEMFVDVQDTSMNVPELNWTNRGSWTVPNYSQVPVTTDHYDVFRTGANVHETSLNTSNAGGLSPKGTISLPATDGCIWGQPLYVPQVNIGGQLKNVLYFATGHANVYAYDADSLGFLWSKSLWQSVSGATGPPPPSMNGDGYEPDLVDCGNQFPYGSKAGSESGVVGTPVIDLSSNTIYVVGNLYDGTNIYYYLFAKDLSTGADRIAPYKIVSTGQMSPAFNPKTHLQRPGLLLADYNIVASYASYANQRPYQGWMFDFNRGNLVLLDNWNYAGSESDPNGNLCGNSQGGAGIWMSAGGPAFDGTDVYFATGNNEPDVTGGCGNSLLQVNPYGGPGKALTGFAQINRFTPTQASNWGGLDLDLASSRMIVVPGTNDVLVGGKSGTIYVVDRTSFAQQAAFNVYPGFDITQTGPEISGGLAYWNNRVYTWASGEQLKTFTPPGEYLRSFSLSGQAGPSGPDPNGAEQGIPISISANFDDTSTGLVWAAVPPYPLDPHNGYDPTNNPDAIHEFVTGTLRAYNASALNQVIGSYSLGGNYIVKFTPPLVANGKVYVVTVKNVNGTASGSQIMVFGL